MSGLLIIFYRACLASLFPLLEKYSTSALCGFQEPFPGSRVLLWKQSTLILSTQTACGFSPNGKLHRSESLIHVLWATREALGS